MRYNILHSIKNKQKVAFTSHMTQRKFNDQKVFSPLKKGVCWIITGKQNLTPLLFETSTRKNYMQ
jgi:hypothetical protein